MAHRKTKTQRINLRKAGKPTEGKKYAQVLVTTDDHGKIPGLALALKAAHPDTEFSKVADVLHFCIKAQRQALGLEGA